MILAAGLALAAASSAHAQIAPGELVAPKMEISGGNVNFTVQRSVSGRNYQLQYSDTMAGGTWQDLGVVRSGVWVDEVCTSGWHLHLVIQRAVVGEECGEFAEVRDAAERGGKADFLEEVWMTS